MDGENTLGQQQLEALAVMSDGSLPVLGRLPAADELEFVRRQPRPLEVDTRPFTALAQFRQVHGRLVLTTLHLQNHFTILDDGFHKLLYLLHRRWIAADVVAAAVTAAVAVVV